MFQVNEYELLAKRIHAGEVVFFIGAGFSVDSEGNTGWTLVKRLTVRLLGLLELCEKYEKSTTVVDEYLARLTTTLGLNLSPDYGPKPSPLALLDDKVVSKLADNYYIVNDWMRSAYSHLLKCLDEKVDEAQKPHLDQELENLEIALWGPASPGSQVKCRLAEVLNFKDDLLRGKVMFLDAMGFSDTSVMAGEPRLAGLDEVRQSYEKRLLPRHRVLAWLAREGLCPVLVTTNYDLLLEGGYRLAGMAPLDSEEIKPVKPTSPYERFNVIAGATQFFNQTLGHRSARIVKIHGCVKAYRAARVEGAEQCRKMLPSIVFTYREIQNWRGDAWSRDYLSSLLRSHTLVFSGYSTADPVLHDTIRNIYEEMAERNTCESARTDQPKAAPAFFMGSAGKREFHGLEILRSASRIHDDDKLQDLLDHDHYLEFQFKPKSGEIRFPLVDDLMLWLFHRTVRRIQQASLEADLGRLAKSLFGRPKPETDYEKIRACFKTLFSSETDVGNELKGMSPQLAHMTFNRVVAWSRLFRNGLMREMGMAEVRHLASKLDPTPNVLRETQWYFPSLGRGEWTAWSAVVELALRRRIAHWQRRDALWHRPDGFFEVRESGYPQLAFSSPANAAPYLLSIRMIESGLPNRQASPNVRRGLQGNIEWRIRPDALPWRTDADSQDKTPDAQTLWNWACGIVADNDNFPEVKQ